MKNFTSDHIDVITAIKEHIKGPLMQTMATRFLSVAESSLHSREESIIIFRTCFKNLCGSDDPSLVKMISSTTESFVGCGFWYGGLIKLWETWHKTISPAEANISPQMRKGIVEALSKTISSQTSLRQLYRLSGVLDETETGLMQWAQDLGFVPQMSLTYESWWEGWVEDAEALRGFYEDSQ